MKLLLAFTLSLMCGSVYTQHGTELSIAFDEDIERIICDSASKKYSQMTVEITNEEPRYKKPYAREKHTYKFLNDSVFLQILPKSKHHGLIKNEKIYAYDIKEKKANEVVVINRYDSLDYTIEVLKFPSSKNNETVYKRFKTDSLGREIESFVHGVFTSRQINRAFLDNGSVKETHYDVKGEKASKIVEITTKKDIDTANGLTEKEVTQYLNFYTEGKELQVTVKTIVQKIYTYSSTNSLIQVEILEYDEVIKDNWDRRSVMKIGYKK